jgi:TonB-linked SusC/RagA family outer membrane protein
MSKLLLLLALCFLHLCAICSPIWQNEPKITLKAKNITLKSVFDSISAKTSYSFFYGSALLDDRQKVSVNFSKTPLSDVLNEVFKHKSIKWVLTREGYIQLSPKSGGSSASGISASNAADTTIAVKGRVVNFKGEPVAGATVLVKGTRAGSTSLPDGTFTISNIYPNAILVISNVSYLTQEISLKGRTILGAITLKDYVGELDETVIIAYGTTTKRYSTSNITSIKKDAIEKQPVSNPLLALQGRTPGVEITQATGVPGSGITVRIRGQNSIINSNDPLYIIDGVPYVSQLLPGLGNIRGGSGMDRLQGNPLTFLNPADIESIDILKDADATAIYGSRAANGAVLITTRKGKAGETKISINAYTGWGKVTRKLDLLNTKQYLEIRREAFANDNAVPNPENHYDLFNNYSWDTSRYTDWQKEMIGGTSRYNNLDASISGGTSNAQYLIGSTYKEESTVFPGDFSDKKTSLHFNLNTYSTNKKFRAQLSANYLYDDNNLLKSDPTAYITLPPNAPQLYNPDGSYNWAQKGNGASTWPGFAHPLASAIERKFSTTTYNLVASGLIGYKLLSNLEIRSNFGYTNMQTDEHAITPRSSFGPGVALERRADFADNSIVSWVIEPQINYDVSIYRGHLNLLVGGTIQQNTSKGESYFGTGFNSDALLDDIRSASDVQITETLRSKYEYSAIFGKMTYNLHDKYLVNITARRDGSSRFGKESKFHNFGALGIGWIFSNEPFIQDGVTWLSFGKFRASYGTTGSDQIGDYNYLDLYYSGDFNYQGVRTLRINNLFNPLLKWEETKKAEAAIELGILDDKIFFSASYYNNRSGNQLAGYSIPSVTGFRTILANQDAVVRNSGWEFLITSINIQSKSFKWTSSFNISFTRNKLLSISAETADIDPRAVGKPLQTRFLYHFLGVNAETGQYEFSDKDGKATYQPDYTTASIKEVNLRPRYFGGFQNNFTYKGLSLDVLFQFVNQLGENNIFGRFPGSNVMLNQPTSVLQRWQKPGDISNVQRANQNSALSQSYIYAKGSNAAYSDASFIRLKNLSLAYQLPSSLTKRVKSNSCQLYLQCQNLLTITDYEGSDPETRSVTTLPPLRVITTGIRIVFN